MKYEFIVKWYRAKTRHHSIMYQRSETSQEFVNRHIEDFSYNTVIDIVDNEMKIITDTIDGQCLNGVKTENLKISDIKTIYFKKKFTGNIFMLGLALCSIILLVCFILFSFKLYKGLVLLIFLEPLFYIIIDDIVELMVIEKANGEQFLIPVNKGMGDDFDYMLPKFLEELLNKNSSIIICNDKHDRFKKFNKISKKILIIFGILSVFAVILSVVIKF